MGQLDYKLAPEAIEQLEEFQRPLPEKFSSKERQAFILGFLHGRKPETGEKHGRIKKI